MLWLLSVLALVFAPGLVAALSTKPFLPDPALAPLRAVVSGFVVAGGGLLVASLFADWWTFHNFDLGTPSTGDAGSPFVRLIVGTGVACAGLTLLGIWGRRNWAVFGLPFAWVLLGLARLWVTGGLDLEHNNGEILSGLTLASWGLLLLTAAAAAASVIRIAERRARPTVPPAPS